MPDYHIVWEIDITADNPRAAALEAEALQKEAGAHWVFDVITKDGETVRIDLEEDSQNSFECTCGEGIEPHICEAAEELGECHECTCCPVCSEECKREI